MDVTLFHIYDCAAAFIFQFFHIYLNCWTSILLKYEKYKTERNVPSLQHFKENKTFVLDTPGDKGRPAREADNFTAIREPIV
jgi:hypothetical protein